MPHGFEYVVRPFQAPGSLGATIIPGTPERTAEQARITWGGVGTMPAVRLLNPGSEVKICQENLGEQGRDSDNIKIPIQGSEDESYVEVARAKQVRLRKDEFRNDENLGTTSTTPQKLDPALDPHKDNFSTPSDPRWKSSWKSGWGQCAVTWNMKNE